jgi:hypothetical protein
VQGALDAQRPRPGVGAVDLAVARALPPASHRLVPMATSWAGRARNSSCYPMQEVDRGPAYPRLRLVSAGEGATTAWPRGRRVLGDVFRCWPGPRSAVAAAQTMPEYAPWENAMTRRPPRPPRSPRRHPVVQHGHGRATGKALRRALPPAGGRPAVASASIRCVDAGMVPRDRRQPCPRRSLTESSNLIFRLRGRGGSTDGLGSCTPNLVPFNHGDEYQGPAD